MKTKNKITKWMAGATVALASVMTGYGQNNLGASCGCPPVNARTTQSLSTLSGAVSLAPGISDGVELTQGGNLTCDKIWILDKKVYVGAGQILNIQPGTVIKGVVTGTSNPTQAVALVVPRNAKIIAAGVEDCPIVFTSVNDPVNGTYAISNKGDWGGLVILGKATNNLLLAANGPFTAGVGGKLAAADGLGYIEGFANADYRNRFGVATNTAQTPSPAEPGGMGNSFDDNDNSGILRYISIRHSGANLQVGNEINGLTLGSVGRGTSIEHIEVVSCADDNIEMFGGTVNMKYVTMLFGNDDNIDWDLGYSGKLQFVYAQKGDGTFSQDNDSGIEADSDDNGANSSPRSNPVLYNATFVGNEKVTNSADNTGIAGITAKDRTAGEINNSIFARFRHGVWLVSSPGTGLPAQSNTYYNWSNAFAGSATNPQSLKIKCNTFVGTHLNPLSIAGATTALLAGDFTQFTTTDLNTVVAGNTLPGFSYTFAVNPATNVFSAKPDVIPNPALSTSGCPVAPVDGFFVPAPYRGAFASTGGNWLSDWSYSAVIGTTQGVANCPTDINLDGVTDVNDFLIFAPSFGTSCQ